MDNRTYIGNTIYEVGEKASYDAQVKKLLSDKTILARIIKETVEEFSGYSVEQIRDCIEGEPEVGMVRVRPGYEPEAITGNSTEDAIIGEGKVTYDILFHVITPTAEKVKLIINVENQEEENPLIGMLDTLLSEELTPAKKEEYMEEKYGVMMSVEGKEALNRMCNLSDLIEEKGIQKGRDEIIEKLLRKNYLVEQIAEMLDIDAALVENIEERLYIK